MVFLKSTPQDMWKSLIYVAGDPILVAACKEKDEYAMKYLLRNGNDPDCSSNGIGLSPLGLAAIRIDTKTMELLLAYGSDMYRKDWEGDSPFDYCIETQRYVSARIFIRNGARLRKSKWHGHKHTIPLMEYEFDIIQIRSNVIVLLALFKRGRHILIGCKYMMKALALEIWAGR